MRVMSDEGDKREDIFLGDGWPMVRIIFRKGKRESNILRFPFVKYVLTVDFSTNVAVGTFSFYFLISCVAVRTCFLPSNQPDRHHRRAVIGQVPRG